jgi:hypothetical protein
MERDLRLTATLGSRDFSDALVLIEDTGSASGLSSSLVLTDQVERMAVAGEDGAIPSALVCLCILPLALLGDVVIGDIIEEVDILVFLVTFRGLYMYTGVAVALWTLR